MPGVAFYAPMKSPRHPVPSGDREMARNLMAAISAGGSSVNLVSEFRVHDKSGDPEVQADLIRQASGEADRVIRSLAETNLDMWVTYHSYYKAPDLIGPEICKALNLPYVQIEATRAKRRTIGPWAAFANRAEAACDAADLIFYMTALDLLTLERDRTATQQLAHLKPFLPLTDLPEPAEHDGPDGPIFCAGMMRHGDKMDSYRIIAQTLGHLEARNWRVEIAGDGEAREDIQALFAPFQNRVTFLGQLDRATMARAYARASVFLWPGVNEAYGMVFLEAQAAGLPVVAQDRPGARDVLLAGTFPDPQDGPEALAKRLDHYLQDGAARKKDGSAAREQIRRFHLQPSATRRFWSAAGRLAGRVS